MGTYCPMTRSAAPAGAFCLLALLTLGVPSLITAAEHPLSDVKVKVKYGNPLKPVGHRPWKVAGDAAGAPAFGGATLRIAGAYGQGGTEAIPLTAAAWTALANGAGYKYADRHGSAGGIKSIVVKAGRNGRPGS